MTTLGHIGKFDPSEESISVYLERMELFFAANGKRDEKKVGVFLLVIGLKNYALLCDLLTLDKPQQKSVIFSFFISHQINKKISRHNDGLRLKLDHHL